MKKITVFTSTTCGSCVHVKKYLNRKGCDFVELNIDDSPELMNQVTELTGYARVPVTMVEEAGIKRVTTGFNPGELASLVS